MKSNLPEWATTEDLCDCSDCDYAIKMHNALLIAWEALERINIGQDDKSSGMSTPPVSYSRDAIRLKAKEAMRRINELGEGVASKELGK